MKSVSAASSVNRDFDGRVIWLSPVQVLWTLPKLRRLSPLACGPVSCRAGLITWALVYQLMALACPPWARSPP